MNDSDIFHILRYSGTIGDVMIGNDNVTLESIREAIERLGPRPPSVEIWVNSAVPLHDGEGRDLPAISINQKEARESIARALPMLGPLLEKEPVHPEIVIMMHPARYLAIATLIPDNIPVHWAGGIEKLDEEEE